MATTLLFSFEGWKNCWCRGFRIIITVRVAYATTVRRNTTWIAACFRHSIFAKSDTPASEPFRSDETAEHTSNCEFLIKIYHLPSFWKSLSSIKLSPKLTAVYSLTTSHCHQIEVRLYADISENTIPFEDQSINDFSGIDISQIVEAVCFSTPIVFSM